MLKILQKIDKKLDNNNNNNNNNNNKRGCDNEGKHAWKKPRREGQCYVVGKRMRWDIIKYCYSHGACAHPSGSCPNPRKGHKKSATFKNKMGGSLDFCQFVKDE